MCVFACLFVCLFVCLLVICLFVYAYLIDSTYVICYAMLRYATLCYAMSCYVMLCYAMLCYVFACYEFVMLMRCMAVYKSYVTDTYGYIETNRGKRVDSAEVHAHMRVH